VLLLDEAENVRAELSTDRPWERGNSRPISLSMLRTWFSRSRRMLTRRDRATSSDRTAWLSSLLTRTSRYQPTLISSANLRASFGSLLFILADRGRMSVPSIDADYRQADTLELVPEPTRHGTGLEADALRVRRSLADRPGECARIRGDLALEQHLAVLVHNGKRKLTPTFRLGFDLARLRVVVGEAVWDGWDRELVRGVIRRS
jgi:hypothetical protein